MILNIEYTNQFKRDLKKAKKQGKDLKLLKEVMQNIAQQKHLAAKLRDHRLGHNWSNHRELHLQSDWLLIYKLMTEQNLVIFVRLGSHAELFNM